MTDYKAMHFALAAKVADAIEAAYAGAAGSGGAVGSSPEGRQE